MNYILSDAEKVIESGNLEKGIEIVNQLIDKNPSDSKALIVKAMVLYKQQKWGDALNVLNLILEFDSDNEIAINYKQMIMNILTFWNKDNYNP